MITSCRSIHLEISITFSISYSCKTSLTKQSIIQINKAITIILTMKILKSQSILLFLLVAPTLQPEVVEANKDSIATDAKSSSSILSSEFRISLLESRLSTLADQIEDLKRVDRCIGSNYQVSSATMKPQARVLRREVAKLCYQASDHNVNMNFNEQDDR